VSLTGPDGSTIEHTTELKSGKKWTCAPLEVKNPRLWWPNGYGDQPLYRLEVSLISDGKVVHTETRQIGLRTLKLEQKKDKHGKSFTFVVNGVRIFCKGANWIPADSFPSRLACEWYEDLIASAAKAHMNMLRIWGGGFYEHECFYDLCDKYGILVWHDFMFACSHYPVNETYLDNVRMEVRENVRRIRHRACLALWCGNNEMEWFLAGGYPNNGNNFQHKLEHHKLFREVIPEVVVPEDPDTPYWPSSPCSCTEFDNPNCEHEGDGHYWEVWHGRLPFTAYRTHYLRFMSEFGFQSLPCMDTVRQFAEPKDWNMTSYIMECHQKNGGANGLILYYLGQTLRFPKDFPSMVYASQILQAEAIRYGVEHWRRNRERCMGTLYWQLNDCWPVASWSSIDYNRKWKGLHYAARRFYNPILLSAEEEGTRVDLHVTNDSLQQFEGTVKWSLEKLDGTKIKSGEQKVAVSAESDKLAAKLDFANDIDKDGVRDTVLVYQLFQKDTCLSTALVAFCPPKHQDIPDANIDVKVSKTNGCVEISLTADKTARFVEIDLPETNLRLSDNFFDLPAGRTKVVQVESGEFDPQWLEKHIVVKSLSDSY
jgi:beta-mannosidase